MREDLAADVARVLAALLDAKAWFRHGVTDSQLSEGTHLPLHRLVVARREAEAQGLVERQGLSSDRPIMMLTPVGVARARIMRQSAL